MNTARPLLKSLLAFTLALAAFSPLRSEADARSVSFHLGAQCLCAQCAFDAQRALSRLDGVQRVTLSAKERRVDMVLDEAKLPVSALALALSKMDLGKDSALLWPLDPRADTAQIAKALGQIPGVQTAKPNAKAHAVLLTFAAKPAVSTTQLDSALKDAANKEAASKGAAHA